MTIDDDNKMLNCRGEIARRFVSLEHYSNFLMGCVRGRDQWRNFGLKSEGAKQNFWLGVLIEWGFLPLQKVGSGPPFLKIMPMGVAEQRVGRRICHQNVAGFTPGRIAAT